jgi:hypothetical protein
MEKILAGLTVSTHLGRCRPRQDKSDRRTKMRKEYKGKQRLKVTTGKGRDLSLYVLLLCYYKTYI